jgi:hypothetical protein
LDQSVKKFRNFKKPHKDSKKGIKAQRRKYVLFMRGDRRRRVRQVVQVEFGEAERNPESKAIRDPVGCANMQLCNYAIMQVEFGKAEMNYTIT